MRRLVVLGLLAFGWAHAEAKKREPPPARSQAFVGCDTLNPQLARATQDIRAFINVCKKLLQQGEAAFRAGRWHPNDGPFGDCQYTKYPFGGRSGPPPPGIMYAVQCAYLSNIHNDAEFRKLIQDEKEAKRRVEAQRAREKEEKKQDIKVRVAAELDSLISVAESAVTDPYDEILLWVANGGEPYVEARENLKQAEALVSESVLGQEEANQYEERITALKPQVEGRALRFVFYFSKSAPNNTKASVRKLQSEELEMLRTLFAWADSVANRLQPSAEPDSDEAKQLAVARKRFARVRADIDADVLRREKEEARRAEIQAIMIVLCVDIPEQQRLLAEATRRKKQLDRESGTRDLALDRELAAQKIALREERADAIRRLKQLGAPYSKAKCSRLE